MTDDIAVLKAIYHCFNARDIDGVLDALTDDVAWANGMDGGHVHGRAGVRDYWTRQWAIVSPQVEPLSFTRGPDGSVVVEVNQSVRDLQGRPLQHQTHGLKDKTVGHVFHLQDGKIARFDIRDDH
ncbi:MAG: nuclear transport factor 2 family protein [Ancalomicrobiaceae bacterium]|nr:nuclear transport factor 2 family protein [Ancalomicrobiaceae bacterium]